MQVQFLGQEDPLEEGMSIHSTNLAWESPWTEELCGLQSMGVTKNQTQLSMQEIIMVFFCYYTVMFSLVALGFHKAGAPQMGGGWCSFVNAVQSLGPQGFSWLPAHPFRWQHSGLEFSPALAYRFYPEMQLCGVGTS